MPERREITEQMHWRAKATLTSGYLLLGTSEVLRGLRHYLLAQSQGHDTNDLLEEKGVERGSADIRCPPNPFILVLKILL